MCSHPPRQRQNRNKRRFSDLDPCRSLNSVKSHPTIVKYRALSINKIFLWELESLSIKHHYALKKELTSDITLSPLKVHMQLSFNFENEEENNNNNNSNNANNGQSNNNRNRNNNNNNDQSNTNYNNNSNSSNNNETESKDECDIRLWLVIDHENERLNKHASFDFGVQYLRKRININDVSNINNNNNNNCVNNESIWSELNAKQSHCASGSMWGFQIGKSLNDLKKYCLPKEDKMLFRFDVEFITKCQSQIGYFNQESEMETLSNFMNRIENLWKNSLFCDVTIECPVHESNGNCKFCDDGNKMILLDGENINDDICKFNKTKTMKKHKKLRFKSAENNNNNNNTNTNNNKQVKQIKPMNMSINDNDNDSTEQEEEDEEDNEDNEDNEDSDIDNNDNKNKNKNKDKSLQLETYLLFGHKCILSSISTVFYAMLNNHLKEHDESHIIISDLCSNTMYHLLNYAYTNGVLSGCDLKALFAAAEKYQIYDLCHICLQRMQSNIKIQNVCDLFVFMLRYKDNHHINNQMMKKFEHNLFQFMVENYPQILKLDSYHKLKSKIESKLTMFMYQKQFGEHK